MKLKFKQQAFQTDAVKAVVDCFAGQPKGRGFKYAIDPGRAAADSPLGLPGMESEGFSNDNIALLPGILLDNLQRVQQRQNLTVSTELTKTSVCDVNLDVEMETGTGKTYCYIKTMFESSWCRASQSGKAF